VDLAEGHGGNLERLKKVKKEDFTMVREYTVALGSQRYLLQRPWPSDDFDFNGICDVAVMEDGRVVALMRSKPALLVFTPDGKKDAEWDVPGLVSGHYLTGRPGGGVLVTDWDGHQVLAVDADGKLEWSIGNPKKPCWNAPFSHPTGAVETPDGRVYVSDGYGNFNVHFFDANRKLLKTIGKPGKGAGEFTTSHCVVVDDQGRVFVADRENHRVQIFSGEGEWLGDIKPVYKPMCLALLPDGKLLVSDQTPTVSLFSAQGELMGRFRTTGLFGHGLSCSRDGCIYVAEMLPSNLAKLTPIE
jgi:sugar lactone lactonase YvrE